MELYRWQKDCLEKWEENGCRGILHVITGAGKTVTALEGARLLEQKLKKQNPDTRLRLRVVTPTVAIARQWVRAVRTAFEDEIQSGEKRVGLWYGEEKDDPDSFCLIYVVNSARHTLSGHVIREMECGNPVLLIADECHHYGSPENRKIFDFRMSPRFREKLYYAIGLSATPQCTYFEEELVPALGPEIYWYQLREAIQEGTVSPFVIFQIDVSLTGDEAEKYGTLTLRLIKLYRELIRTYPWLQGETFFKSVQELAEKQDDPESLPQQYLDLIKARRDICIHAKNRLKCAAELIRRRKVTDRIILFCERIDQARELYRGLREFLPVQAGIYHSEMLPEKRREILQDFRDGVIRILIACKALDEGVDVPDAAIGIVLSSALTDRQRIQRLGRVLRRAAGKRRATLYYLHVGDRADEGDYLPNENDGQPTADLMYNAQSNTFDCYEYSALARTALQAAGKKGTDRKLLLELRKRMDQGVTEAEWLMRPEELEKELREVQDKQRRNFLIAMKLIAQARDEREKEYADAEAHAKDLWNLLKEEGSL